MQFVQAKTIRLLILWLFIIPPTTIYLMIHHWPSHFNKLFFIGILLFSFLSARLPVKLNGKTVHLVLWITIPAFLLYGLLIETIAMQVIVITVYFSEAKQKKDLSNLLIKSLAFFFMSFLSALAFYLAGGEIGMISFWPLLLAVIAYQFTQRATYITLYTVYYKITKQFTGRVSRQLLLEGMMAFLLLPFTFTLYFLVQYVGGAAFFLLGIPFFFVLILWRRHNDAEKINIALEQATAIGLNLSHHTTEKKVIDEFVENVSTMFTADATYLYDHRKDWLESLRIHEAGAFQSLERKPLILKEEIVEALLQERKPLIYERREEWGGFANSDLHDEMQSMFAIPILRDEEVTGVLVVASKQKYEFKQYHLEIAEILCSYFTVLVVRARHMEQTMNQSERCGLTSLYNYNYLEERLQFEYNRLEQKNIQALTVLMLDIDYFKKINDTYGHENGNEILIELAQLLGLETPQYGIVGRYGGEEFLYILPNASKEEGVQLGEKLRSIIETHRFKIMPDLDDLQEEMDVSITVSVGISSIPQDTDELNSLVRNADRALYLGAKRAGRNRVAAYVQ